MRAPTKWRPARLLRIDMVYISVVLLITASARGIDYCTGNDSGARSPAPGQKSILVGIEAAFPLWMWGVMILTASTLLGLGILRGWHAYVWVGHVLLSAFYTALCFGLLPGYLDRPWADGIRNAIGLILPAMLHYLLWWRMGPKPIDPWRFDGPAAA